MTWSLCPKCSARVDVDYRFCPKCGHSFFDGDGADSDGPKMPPDNSIHGVLPEGVMLTEDGIAKFMGTSRGTAISRVIYGEEVPMPATGITGVSNGVACVPVGSKFFVRKAALDKWVQEREAPVARPRKRGGSRTAGKSKRAK